MLLVSEKQSDERSHGTLPALHHTNCQQSTFAVKDEDTDLGGGERIQDSAIPGKYELLAIGGAVVVAEILISSSESTDEAQVICC